MLAIVATSVIQFVLGLSIRRFVTFLNINLHVHEDDEKSVSKVIACGEKVKMDGKNGYDDEDEVEVWWDAEDKV